MSTQPLLIESTADTPHIAYPSLQIGEFQGFQGRYSQEPGQEECGSFEQLQCIPGTLISIEYMPIQEIPLFNELRQEFSNLLSRFTPIMKAKDAELYRHSLRAQSLALAFTTSVLHFSEAETLTIGLAAFFHEIGKMNINDKILLKASGLTRQEFEIIKGHPAYGATMLSQFKLLKNVLPMVYHHHERLDGKGYPDGIRGEAIPPGARIVAIVDAFEAMTSYRNYQNRRTPLEALEELHKHAGTQFDAELVELFCKSLEIPLQDSTNLP